MHNKEYNKLLPSTTDIPLLHQQARDNAGRSLCCSMELNEHDHNIALYSLARNKLHNHTKYPKTA